MTKVKRKGAKSGVGVGVGGPKSDVGARRQDAALPKGTVSRGAQCSSRR